MEDMEMCEKGEYEEHEIECAARDVLKAEEIKADPKMWPKVQAKLKEQGEAIKKITSMKQLKQVVYEKTRDEKQS